MLVSCSGRFVLRCYNLNMLSNFAFKTNFNCVKCVVRCFTNRNVLALRERDMFHDLFPENSAGEVTDLLNAKPQWVYAGFDPTADSLHVGNLLVLVNLLHWQRGGHNVIALLGGATAKIGDPSGRSMERDEIATNIVENNLKGIRKNIESIFENHEKYFWNAKRPLSKITIVNNEEWYDKMTGVQLIGGPGRFLRMGTLLSRTSVQTRLNSANGMSFTEFSYQLFQAYDWLYLFKKYGCRFQVGGADQMGNIMSGHDLIGKVCRKAVYGLTLPIITTEMGDKFGKSAGNAVWLSASKTSPFTLYQFWMRLSDIDALKLLKLFSFLSLGEINDIVKQHTSNPEKRIAQKKLAEIVTTLVHGPEGLKTAENATQALYEGKTEALGHMSVSEVVKIFEGADLVEVLHEIGMDMVKFGMKAKCFPTEKDALRIISAGGFYVNQQRVKNPSEIINLSVHSLPNQVTIARVGKKNYYIVKWV